MSADETSRTPEYDRAPVTYEVWRVGPVGRPVRIYFGMDESAGRKTLALCEADKADGYPEASVDFHLVRATTARVRVTSPGQSSADQGGGQP